MPYNAIVFAIALPLVVSLAALTPSIGWPTHAGDAQHSARFLAGVQHLDAIKWSVPVDINPRYSGNDLLSHYGSPIVSAGNVLIFGQKQELDSGFILKAFNATTGAPLWTEPTDYVMPPHGWTPSYGPCLSGFGLSRTTQFVVFPMAGGRVGYRAVGNDGARTRTIAFYGNAEYEAHSAEYDDKIRICTPLTPGPDGNVYFGYLATDDNPAHIQSGIAKVDFSHGSWVAATSLSADTTVNRVKMNGAPAITANGDSLYATLDSGGFGHGCLVKLATSDLHLENRVVLMDPRSGLAATVEDTGTQCPMIGPDGDVYIGVLENPFPGNHDRGWMLHFSGDLATTKIPGAFGWDDTASVVPASSVPSYTGPSSYLIVTKYNNYAGVGGDGVNRIALLDPNVSTLEPISNFPAMAEVASIAGPTPDAEFVGTHPNAVREWCVNTAAVDVAGHSVLLNCEDGILYRWSLDTFALTESIQLTAGIGEAYTTTMIGNDGLIFGISNARLYCVGSNANRRRRK